MTATSKSSRELVPIGADVWYRNVVWLADSNYRLDLENDVVRQFAIAGELDELVAADQVRASDLADVRPDDDLLRHS